MYEMNNAFGLSSTLVLSILVASKYCLKQATGHSFVFSGKEDTIAKTGTVGWFWFVLR